MDRPPPPAARCLLVAPAAVPRDCIRRVNGAAQRALRSADVRAKLQELGFEIAGGSPESFASWTRAEIAAWPKIVRAANMKPRGTP